MNKPLKFECNFPGTGISTLSSLPVNTNATATLQNAQQIQARQIEASKQKISQQDPLSSSKEQSSQLKRIFTAPSTSVNSSLEQVLASPGQQHIQQDCKHSVTTGMTNASPMIRSNPNIIGTTNEQCSQIPLNVQHVQSVVATSIQPGATGVQQATAILPVQKK